MGYPRMISIIKCSDYLLYYTHRLPFDERQDGGIWVGISLKAV